MQLGVKDVARFFKIREKTVYHWVKHKGLPVYKVNEQYRFSRADLLEWAIAAEISVTPQIIQEVLLEEQAPLYRLCDALETGNTHYGVNGADKASALHDVVRLLNLPEEMDRRYLYELMSARGTLGLTNIGDGIFIPHVRCPMIFRVSHPMMAIHFFDRPVNFGISDGCSVEILFTLVSPTVRSHLHLISKLAFALSDSGFKDVVTRRCPLREIYNEACRIEDSLSL